MRKMSHLAAWIAILMLLLISSGNAECTEDEKLMIGDYQIRCYEKRDVHDYVEIIKYTGNDSEIIIPEMIGDGIVRKICRNAFSNEKIKSIEIPSCVRILEWGFYPHGELWSGQVIPVEINVSPDNQFYETVDNVLYHKPEKSVEYCTDSVERLVVQEGTIIIGGTSQYIDEVRIPDTVEYIYDYAFSNSDIRYVEIPDSVVYMGERAFNDVQSLKGIKLSESMTSIESGTFSGCMDIHDIRIPKSIQFIGDYAFECHPPEMKAYVDPGSYAEQYCIENEIDYEYYDGTGIIKKRHITDTIESTLDFSGKQIIFGTGEIPSYLEDEIGEPYEIGSCVVSDCNVLEIGNGITNVPANFCIYVGCFSKGPSTIIIGDDVEIIGEYAFKGCQPIDPIIVPDSVKEIGKGAFSGMEGKVIFPEGLQVDYEEVFAE